MTLLRFANALCLGLLAVSCAGANAKERFTPEIMLQNEELGEVKFAPQGTHLFIDKHRPYRSREHFDRDRDWSRGLSQLAIYDLDSGKTVEVSRSAEDRTWYLGSSLDGRYAAFGWLDGAVQKIGIWDHASGRQNRLDVPASVSALPVVWLSDHTFLTSSNGQEEQEMRTAFTGYGLRKVFSLSELSWRGDVSVKVLGSGRFRTAVKEPPADLIVVDARSGDARAIDRGTIGMFLERSPDGSRVAYLRKTGAFDMSGVKVKAIIDAQNINQLVVYSTDGQAREVASCDGCSVDDGSLRWSPSGKQLYFSARRMAGERFAHRHFVYDAAANSVSPFQVRGLDYDTEEYANRATFLAPLLWIDDEHLAVRTRRQDAGQFEDQGFAWHLIKRDGSLVRELTKGVPRGDDKQAFYAPVAAHGGALLMIADHRLWRLPIQGDASPVSSEGIEVDSWCVPYGPWRMVTPKCDALKSDNVVSVVDASALASDRIALRIMKDKVFTGDFLVLDLRDGQARRLQRPSADSMALEVSALSSAAVYQRKSSEGDAVEVAAHGRPPVAIHRFNAHLAGVEAATPVLLTRREPGEDEDRDDWLLLPPDHEPGQRHPLLVYFYPDTRYGKELRSDDLRDISMLNKNIPAAHGYAVLLASMKISSYGTDGGNPMEEMHEQLIRAAENAVAKGYIDPVRWAIMGHSYGGYGTNSVITRTGRFKAAVSMAGPSNLTSGYAIGLNTDKAVRDPEGLNFGAMWSEGGQGRMGVPPWVDPKRYVANSPLFSADKITTPLMLVHGDLDFVNVNEAEQLFTALSRQGKDVQLVRYWGEGHVYASPANIIDMWDRIFAFLDQNLGPAQAADAARAAR